MKWGGCNNTVVPGYCLRKQQRVYSTDSIHKVTFSVSFSSMQPNSENTSAFARNITVNGQDECVTAADEYEINAVKYHYKLHLGISLKSIKDIRVARKSSCVTTGGISSRRNIIRSPAQERGLPPVLSWGAYPCTGVPSQAGPGTGLWTRPVIGPGVPPVKTVPSRHTTYAGGIIIDTVGFVLPKHTCLLPPEGNSLITNKSQCKLTKHRGSLDNV